MSAVGLAGGIIFIGIGIFLVIPHGGAFGVLWTFVCVIITAYHAYNLFSERGIAHEEVDLDTSTDPRPYHPSRETPERRLAKLDNLWRKNLITNEEYQEQRERILDEI